MTAPTQRNPAAVMVVLVLACVSFALSQTLVVPALPRIAEDLHASQAAVSWVLTAFLLSASVSTPIIGKLGDLYGKGRVLSITMLVFSLGAVINALASSIGVLIAGRAMQGVAGAVFPLAFGIVRDTFPAERIPTGLSLIGAIFGIGGGIGLPLSGLIVDNLALEWIFWSSLLGLPAAVAARTLIPPSPTVARVRIDWTGALLLSVALSAILLGISQANDWGWGSPANVGAIGGGFAVLGAFLLVERGVAEPFIDLGVLRHPAVWTTNLTGFLIGVAMFSAFLTIPQFAQTPESTGYGFGASVTEAGLLLLPIALTQLIAGPIAGRLGMRIGFRAILAAGALLTSVAAFLMALAHSHRWEIVCAGVLLGAGITFALGAMANLIVDVVPQSQVGIATGINTVMRTAGGSFGAAITTAVLTGHLAPGSPFPAEGAYTGAFALGAIAGMLAFGAALLVPRPLRQAVAHAT